MSEEHIASSTSNKDAKKKNGNTQYQHQTLTLNDTVGLIIMSLLALALLAGLLSQQKRYQKLVEQLAKQQ